MNINKNDNKFTSLLIFLVSLFVLVFFTKNMFYEMQAKQDTKESLEAELQVKDDELAKLESLEKDLKSGDKKQEIARFVEGFSEDEMLTYLHTYIEEINGENGLIVINSLSFTEAKEGELGFKELGVTVNAKVSNIEILKTFLSFLTSKDAKYTFYVSDFSFPNDNRAGTYNVTIPLKILYK
ncbi:MAG: hypothetical protein PHH06_01830 [Candidatus Gracilibacteria bacterium]|nr:hypothetical protein [Candidatus Gracilibacteria bacterium]